MSSLMFYCLKVLISTIFEKRLTDGPTERPTDNRRTDRPSSRPSLTVVGRKKSLSIATMLVMFLDLLGSLSFIFEKILLGKF